MKRILAVSMMLALLVAAPGFAQHEHPKDAEHPKGAEHPGHGAPAMDEAAMQEAMMKAATPGPFHAFLAKKAGKWTIAGRMWMAPGAEPVTSESTGEAEMILGGRYLLEKMHGSMMGMPFDGLGITGYDNATGVVTSLWMDTMGTATMVMTGKWEKPGAPLETTGRYFDAASGQDMDVRTVTTFVSDDESLFEYFATMAGTPEMKLMELRYTRAR